MPLTRSGPLQWRSGTGWLLLAGGRPRQGTAEGIDTGYQQQGTGEVAAAALGWADLDRPLALLPTAGGSTTAAEEVLDSYVDLGAPSGYVVPVFDTVGAQLAENCRLLEDAGLVIIDDGPDPLNLVRSLRASPALEALARAFLRGAAVMGIGVGAEALGAWIARPQAEADDSVSAQPAWGWVNNVIVASHFQGAGAAPALRHLLELKPNCFGLGIPNGVGLGLGPLGEVENVGAGQVTVVVSGLEVEVQS